mmetsp:Transcript_10080/g.33298  ORF Transcript_10080/g.33298 Transcript_10080/m.33298 type:complete len:231 (+) Transcript_10080:905-1597(+)
MHGHGHEDIPSLRIHVPPVRPEHAERQRRRVRPVPRRKRRRRGQDRRRVPKVCSARGLQQEEAEKQLLGHGHDADHLEKLGGRREHEVVRRGPVLRPQEEERDEDGLEDGHARACGDKGPGHIADFGDFEALSPSELARDVGEREASSERHGRFLPGGVLKREEGGRRRYSPRNLRNGRVRQEQVRRDDRVEVARYKGDAARPDVLGGPRVLGRNGRAKILPLKVPFRAV